MKRIIIGCVSALAVLAIGSTANASNDHAADHARDAAARQCTAERKADPVIFKETYGEHAMRHCINGELKSASQACKREEAADPDAYAAAYGDGPNSHSKCVLSKVKADDEE